MSAYVKFSIIICVIELIMGICFWLGLNFMRFLIALISLINLLITSIYLLIPTKQIAKIYKQ